MKLYRFSLLLCLFSFYTAVFAQPTFTDWTRLTFSTQTSRLIFLNNYLLIGDTDNIFYGLGTNPGVFNAIPEANVATDFQIVTDFEYDFAKQGYWVSGVQNNGTNGYTFFLKQIPNGMNYQAKSLVSHVGIWDLAKDKHNTFFYATNSGIKTFNPINQQFTLVSGTFVPAVSAFSADVNHAGDVIAATNKGLFVQESYDASRWKSAGFSNQSMVYVFCDNENIVWYAAKANSGINKGKYQTTVQLYRSNTQGSVWNATDLSGVAIRKIVKFPQFNTLLAATNLGIYVSNDNGVTWLRSRFRADTYDLYLSGSAFGVYAATSDGIYKTDTSISVNNEVEEPFQNALTLFPNPNPTHYKIMGTANGTLSVFNLLGQMVWSTPLIEMEGKLNLPYLPTGNYSFQFKEGNHVKQRMFTIIR